MSQPGSARAAAPQAFARSSMDQQQHGHAAPAAAPPLDPHAATALAAAGWGGEGGGYAADAGGGTTAPPASDSTQQPYYSAAASGGADEGASGAAAGGEAEAAAASGEAEAAYSPAAYLAQLQAHMASLQQQRSSLQQQLAGAAAGAYSQMSAALGTACTGVPLPAELPALAEELVVLQSLRQHLAYVQELQALMRHADKSVRGLAAQQAQQAAAGGALAAGSPEASALLQGLSEAVDGFSTAVGYAIAVKQLTDEGKVPIQRLQQHAAGLLARVEATQRGLRSVLSAAIQQRLAAVHWPPPLTVSGASGGAAGAADNGGAWRGFAAASPAAAGELQQLLVVLLTLQRASQHEQFAALTEASQEGPLLWAAEELVAPLAERLRHHFASGLPTDRPDRPEWLFATALKAAQQCAPLAQELQPVVDAHQLQSWYSMPLEVARAVQVVGVNALVASHLLPQLVTAADPALWLHLADEALQFEKRFAPLRGASMSLPDEEEFLAAAHPGSTIELLFECPEWQEGWLGAEVWDATRQLDAACEAYSAWQPAAQQLLAVAGQEEDMVPETPRSRGGAAWRREFWPPVCAEQVASLVGGLVRRGGWVHSHDHKLRYMQAVPLATLKAFRERLGGLLAQAEQFRGLLGDTWLPRVGAAVCAAHYLEHHLREPQGVLLQVELQDAAAAGGGGGGGAAAPGGRSVAALVEREATAFASLRKQWAYTLAKQAVDRFHQLFAPYKHDGGIFTAGYDEGQPPEAQAAAAAAAGPPAPSPPMLLAADSLQQLLRALAQHLDAVVFRDVWKSVALAVNYAVYNEVATEALFSPQGAAQLDADLAAMSVVFGEYTSRSVAHFRESREACRLLGLPWAAAAQLLGALEADPRAAKQLLAPHGVKALNAEQAAVVLGQRLDLLTGRPGAGAAAAAHQQQQYDASAAAQQYEYHVTAAGQQQPAAEYAQPGYQAADAAAAGGYNGYATGGYQAADAAAYGDAYQAAEAYGSEYAEGGGGGASEIEV